MPTTTLNPTVELFGFSELMDYAVDQTGMPTASVMQAINAEARQRYFSSSLTWNEAQAEALSSWLNKQGFTINYNGNQQWMGSAYQTVAQVETPSLID